MTSDRGGESGSPADTGALLDQAVRHHRAGRLDEAAALYGEVLAHRPDDADALHMFGIVAHQRGDHARAAELISRAIAIDGDQPNYHNNFGIVLAALGRHEPAVEAFQRALAASPDAADLLQNLGVALQKLGRHEDALPRFEKAVALVPESAEAHFNAGNALQGLNRHADAIACFERALERAPDDPRIRNNAGLSLVALGAAEPAVEQYRQAIEGDPDNAEFYNNLGNALDLLNRPDEALGAFRETLGRDPRHANALSQAALIARKLCDWDGLAETEAAIVDHVRHGSAAILPFAFLAICDDPALQAACAVRYRSARTPAPLSQPPARPRAAGPKLRIAYISENFRQHAVAHLIAELLERHDRSKFEICAFSYGRDDESPIRRRIEQAVDEFHDVRQDSDREIVERIAAGGIDILVDLAGHTERNRLRLLAHRPAPVQAHFLGYPGTLGADFIDYLFVDPFLVPPGAERNFTESLVYLPDTYQVNDRMRPIADAAPAREDCLLPRDGFVFCGFHQSYKITPAMFDIWAGLLRDVPGSVLWLLRGGETAEQNLRAEAKRRGVDPDRLVFAPGLDLPDHLARLGLADLFLDTLPYNGHTTASDALWAGLPVLTCAGSSMAARVAGSLLHAIGLPELVTGTLDGYAALARDLASDPDRLAALRATLAANRKTAPLFDTDRFRRHIEAAYAEMWAIRQSGEPPRPITVSPIQK